jgi:hypothetical protein
MTAFDRLNMFVVVLLLLCGSSAHAACPAKDLKDLRAVLQKGIALRESFEAALGQGDENKYQSMRADLERFTEETLSPCLEIASKKIASRQATSLTCKALEVIRRFDASADEQFLEALARIFSSVPNETRACVLKLGRDELVAAVEQLRNAASVFAGPEGLSPKLARMLDQMELEARAP